VTQIKWGAAGDAHLCGVVHAGLGTYPQRGPTVGPSPIFFRRDTHPNPAPGGAAGADPTRPAASARGG
jgi:hypothetical protein